MEDIKLGGVDTSGAENSLKKLRETIKAAKDEMIAAGEGTDRYNAALRRAADAQFQMREMNEQIRASAMDLGAVLQNSTRVLQGLAGGYTAFQGITTLLGVENENLQQTFVKLQAAMAIVQGIDGIDGMFKSMKNLKLISTENIAVTKTLTAVQKAWNYVMNLNPIFILVTVLAAVTAGIILFTNAMKKNNEEIAESNRLLESNIRYQNLLASDMEYNAKLSAALGKEQIDILRDKLKATEELDKVNEQEIERLFQKIYIEKKATEEEKKRYDELIGKREEYRNKIKGLNDDITILDISSNKKREDEYKKNNQKIEEEQRKHNEKMLADTEKFNQEYIDNLHQKSMEELEIEMEKNEEFLQKQYEWNLNKNQRQLDSDQRFRDYNRQLTEDNYLMMDELDRAAFLNKKTTESEYQKSILQNQIDFNAKLLDDTTIVGLERTQIENDMAEARKQIALIEKEEKLQAMSAVGELMGNITGLVGKNTAIGKTLAVAQATIDTYVGAQRAYTGMLSVPIVGTTLAPVAAGVAVAAGLKNVQQILKVKVPKGGGGGGNSTPSAPALTAPKIPTQISAVRSVKTDSEVQLQQQPIKAYVVESEITSTQNNVNGIKKEAEF
jgi:hypothetical protein